MEVTANAAAHPRRFACKEKIAIGFTQQSVCVILGGRQAPWPSIGSRSTFRSVRSCLWAVMRLSVALWPAWMPSTPFFINTFNNRKHWQNIRGFVIVFSYLYKTTYNVSKLFGRKDYYGFNTSGILMPFYHTHERHGHLCTSCRQDFSGETITLNTHRPTARGIYDKSKQKT